MCSFGSCSARALFDRALHNLFFLIQVLVHRCRSATELNGKPSLSSNTEKGFKHELTVMHTSVSG